MNLWFLSWLLIPDIDCSRGAKISKLNNVQHSWTRRDSRFNKWRKKAYLWLTIPLSWLALHQSLWISEPRDEIKLILTQNIKTRLILMQNNTEEEVTCKNLIKLLILFGLLVSWCGDPCKTWGPWDPPGCNSPWSPRFARSPDSWRATVRRKPEQGLILTDLWKTFPATNLYSIHCGASTQSQCFVLSSFGSSAFQLGCTVAAASAQRQLEHVKNDLQNITTRTEWTPYTV